VHAGCDACVASATSVAARYTCLASVTSYNTLRWLQQCFLVGPAMSHINTCAFFDDVALRALPVSLTSAVINSRRCCASSVYDSHVFLLSLGLSAVWTLCYACRVCVDERAAAVHNGTYMSTHTHPLLPHGKATVLYLPITYMLLSRRHTPSVYASCFINYLSECASQPSCWCVVCCLCACALVLVLACSIRLALRCFCLGRPGCFQSSWQPLFCCFTAVARSCYTWRLARC
jgi:hypothetical protein